MFTKDIWKAEEHRFVIAEEIDEKFDFFEEEMCICDVRESQLAPMVEYQTHVKDHPPKTDEWLGVFELMDAELPICVFTSRTLVVRGQIESLEAWLIREREGLFAAAEKAYILICKPLMTGETIIIQGRRLLFCERRAQDI